MSKSITELIQRLCNGISDGSAIIRQEAANALKLQAAKITELERERAASPQAPAVDGAEAVAVVVPGAGTGATDLQGNLGVTIPREAATVPQGVLAGAPLSALGDEWIAGLIERLERHSDDDRNTAFARSVMGEILDALKGRVLAATPAAESKTLPRESEGAIAKLIEKHAELLDANPYAYFELAYTRQTGWMAWLTDRPAQGEPGTAAYAKSRKVIARGQGDTAVEACADAVALLDRAAASGVVKGEAES